MIQKKNPQKTTQLYPKAKVRRIKDINPNLSPDLKSKKQTCPPMEEKKLTLNKEISNSHLKICDLGETTLEENNENLRSNNLFPFGTPKEEKNLKIPISISHTDDITSAHPEENQNDPKKDLELDDPMKKQKKRDSSIKDKKNVNQLTTTKNKLIYFANNSTSNKISQKLLPKMQINALMNIPIIQQDEEYFNYEDEKPVELTKDEKEIFGNREMKNYRKIKLLGKGGCGIVWLSTSNAKHSECAVKQICKKNLSTISTYISPGNNQMAKKEIEILKFLNSDQENKCDYIVDFYDSYEDQNDIWFAFEKGGKCLSSLEFKIKGDFLKSERIYAIKKGRFIKWLFSDIEQFKLLIRQLLEAIDFINTRGIIHADIKPENILIDYNDPINGEKFEITKMKIIDYGSAFYADDPGAISSNTPEYLCPELTEIMEGKAKNKKTFLSDLKSFVSCVDIWSLGITLLELVLCCPVWMSYKAKVMINGKSTIQMGLFGFKGRDGNKINSKQIELTKNLHKVLSQSMLYMFTDTDKKLFEDLISKMLNPKYKERITPKEALLHEFLNEEK